MGSISLRQPFKSNIRRVEDSHDTLGNIVKERGHFKVSLFMTNGGSSGPHGLEGGPPGSKSGPPQSKGGPPGSMGGPPGSKGGPPGAKGGPPGSNNGPPGQLAQVLDTIVDVAFALLYLGDSNTIRDSSKNLRVLWTRALLHSLEKIEDPVAEQLLPRRTRWVVGKLFANLVWKNTPVVDKLDWIVNRTKFIDSQLNEFLEETKESDDVPRQIILLGGGYDTRSLRYQLGTSNIQFYEVDLESVTNAKRRITESYSQSNNILAPKHIALDLNEILTKDKKIVSELQMQGFQKGNPTMLVCEAVLFYLIPGAVQKLTKELFELNADRYCFTDNLAKVGVAPGPPVPSPKEKCEDWLQNNGKELVAHEAIWGGAIHFVGAK